MQQTTKLQIYMSPSNTGQQQIELVKASQCLSELGNNIYIYQRAKTNRTEPN